MLSLALVRTLRCRFHWTEKLFVITQSLRIPIRWLFCQKRSTHFFSKYLILKNYTHGNTLPHRRRCVREILIQPFREKNVDMRCTVGLEMVKASWILVKLTAEHLGFKLRHQLRQIMCESQQPQCTDAFMSGIHGTCTKQRCRQVFTPNKTLIFYKSNKK